MTLTFDFHGFRIEATASDPAVEDGIRRDFSYFRSEAAGSIDLRIDARLEAPPFDGLPDLRASFLTPRNVCYQDGARMIIDYFGRGLAIWDKKENRCTMHSADPDLLNDIAYLFILSTVGQHLDRAGLHRVHALGVAHAGRGMLLLLPSGGGKSTMALALRNEPGFSILSEDTPLVDPSGRLLPFPLRFGVKVGDASGVDPKYLRTVRRMEFDPKTLIDVDYFDGRIAAAVPADTVLIGERHLGTVSEIVPTSSWDAARELFKNLVVGLGVYQGLEFLLERGLGDALGQTGVGLSRLRCAISLAGGTHAYRFRLGRDKARNLKTFVEFANGRPR